MDANVASAFEELLVASHTAAPAEVGPLLCKHAAGLDVDQLTIYLIDLNDFQAVNQVYGSFFEAPYPARATVQVAALPKGGRVEIDAVVSL